MKYLPRKVNPGLPRYDGVGAAMAALVVHPTTRQVSQVMDATMTRDDWKHEARTSGSGGPKQH